MMKMINTKMNIMLRSKASTLLTMSFSPIKKRKDIISNNSNIIFVKNS